MRVFVTGATGFIGTAVVKELLRAGHTVSGLSRSDEGAAKLKAAGAEVHRGNLEDLESIRSGAAAADGVIHLGFDHDFSKFMDNCAQDKRVIEAIGEVLAISGGPLVITSGVGLGAAVPGELASEDYFNPEYPHPRIASELAGAAASAKGVNVSVVRLPQVHDAVKQGLITWLVPVAREKGVAAYVGDGMNRWSAVHVSDCARLYRMVLEKHVAGSRYNAVAEEGVSSKDIAEALGRGLNVPVKSLSAEEAAEHFGWMASFVGWDMSGSSELTRERLGWTPTGRGLMEDLAAMDYSKS
jgi:nucleoside-diphosphate-sugar epimerase